MRHFTLFPLQQLDILMLQTIAAAITAAHVMQVTRDPVHAGFMTRGRSASATWGTQAIDYSWANLMNTMPHKLHPHGFRKLM